MQRTSRRGFTLFQLLIVLAILAILLGLLLPAVAKVREAAARMQSQNNLKQLGIACHAYHDANAVFPSGVDDNNFSASAHILPYIEQDAVYKTIDFKKSIDDKDNKAARALIVKVFLNVTDGVTQVSTDYGATNYLYNAGSKSDLKDNDGVFYLNSKLKITSITDGTSNTLMIIETLKGDGGTKAVDVHRQHVSLTKDALKDLNEKSGADDWKDNKNIKGDRCASWMDGRFLQGTITATRMLNDERPDVNCGGAGGLSGPRTTGTVVNTAFCDGSVRAVTTKVKLQTWQSLATRAGGEVVTDF